MLKRSPLIGHQFSRQALDALTSHHWPGNVRELQNEVRRALVLCDGAVLGPELLSHRVLDLRTPGNPDSDVPDGECAPLKRHLELFEGQLIRTAMLRHKGNKTHVAQELGLTRVGLRMKLIRLGLV
jgi:two-component system response regulator HupR/HoxA